MSRPFWKSVFAKVRPTPALRKIRPSLECLEDRFMPATRIWDGGAVSNNWTNANNWAGNIAPVAGDDLVFPGNVADKTADNNFAAGTFFKSITLGGGYTLRGARIAIGVGGITSTGSSSNVIKNPLQIATADLLFNIGQGSTVFVDDNITGAGGLVKNGTGNLSLRKDNSYEGLTQINAGGLFVTKSGGLGSTAAGTFVKNGATLVADHSATLVGALGLAEPITLDGGSKLRALREVFLNGDITLAGVADIRQEGVTEELTINGQITGPGGMRLFTENHMSIKGTTANTFTGTTTVFGNVRLGLILQAGGDDIISGPLVIESTGSVVLRDANQINDAAPVTINGNGILRLNTYHETIGALNMNGGRITMGFFLPDNNNIFGPASVGTLTLAGDATFTSTSSGAARIDGNLGLGAQGHTFTVNNGPGDVEFIMDAQVIGTGTVTQTGTGVMQFSSLSPVYAGTVQVNGGTFFVKGTNGQMPVVVNNNGTLRGNGTIGPLTVNLGGAVMPGLLDLSSTTSIATLKVKGNVAFNPGSTLAVKLNGPVAGVSHDQLDVQGGGTVTLNQAILQTIMATGSAVGNQFRIINNDNNDAIQGQFILSNGTPLAQGAFFTSSVGSKKLSINYPGGTLGNDVVLRHENTSAMAPDLVLDRTELDEGGYVTATGSLVDPDNHDRLRLFVNWGDGTPTEVLQPGRDPFSLRHRYQDEGHYVASFSWLDDHGQGNSREFEITVNNVAPQALLDMRFHDDEPVFYADFMLLDPGDDPLTLTVDYGDGTPTQSQTVGHRRTFGLKHRFAGAGTFNLTFTLRDGDGGVTQFTRQVTA